MFAELDLNVLLRCGEGLQARPAGLVADGETLGDLLIRALLKIRDKQGRLVSLVPNRAQREYARKCTRRNIVLKARQLGMTTYIAARFFIQTITRPGTLTVQVAHDQRSAEQIFRIVHRFLENLPEGLRMGALTTSRANVRQIVFPRLDSEYRVETAADPSAGRGLTIQNLHCSEVARWPGEAAATLASLRAAVPAEGEVVLESTPAGAAGCFYQEWKRAKYNGYTRHFFPWWYEAAYARPGVPVRPLTAEEEALVASAHLTDAQVAFRREVREQFGEYAPEEFVEHAEACFLRTSRCVFDQAAIERRREEAGRQQEGGVAERRDNGDLLVFFPPRAGAAYIIGVDPAGGGTEGDYACAQVVERTTAMQCAELHGHFGPAELAQKVAALAREYNGALVAVERNNHGHGVLAYLGVSDRYPNIYEQNGQAGWLTNSVSKPRMIADLAAALAGDAGLFQSLGLLEECREYVRHADGTTSAASGAHDDRLMAMAIALAVRAEQMETKRECRFASL
ncbi:MAG: terminase [Terriglobales bacterium]